MNSKPQEKTILDVETWEQTFQELMLEVKPRHRWTLKLDKTLQPDCVAQGWKQYQQKAFGRFRCSSCKRGWGSAQVQVLCHMYLEPRMSQGQVLMRLFAQRCQKCYGAQFEEPEFCLDNGMRILKNLVHRIQERCYGNGIRKYPEISVIPEFPLEGPHDMANCEACTQGFCVQGLQNCMTKPAESPFSYMEIRNSSWPHVGDMCGLNQAMNQSAMANEAQRRGRQTTEGADQQAARRTGSQPIQVTRSLSSGRTDLQPTQAIGSLPSHRASSQSALGTGPQVSQKTYSQVLRQAPQQLKQETVSQATKGTGLQATKKTDLQPTQRAGTRDTHGSGTFNETQGVWRRPESYSPRRSAPDSPSRPSTGRSGMPPNDSLGLDNLLTWGLDCVASLWNYVKSKYF